MALDDLFDHFLGQNDLVQELLRALSEGADVPIGEEVAHSGKGLVEFHDKFFDIVQNDNVTGLFVLFEFELSLQPIVLEFLQFLFQVRVLSRPD